MPAYSENDGVLSTKLLTFFPKNKDTSTHSALIVLFNCQTGIPMAVSVFLVSHVLLFIFQIQKFEIH